MESLLTVKEVSKRTRLGLSSIYVMVTQEAIPHIKLGSRILFDSKELDTWIENQKHPVREVR